METKAKEMLHKLVLEAINDHTSIIQKGLTSALTPMTTVTVTVGKDDENTESIIITFDNSMVRFKATVDLNTYIDLCLKYDIYYTIKSIISHTLEDFSDLMFDILFKPASELEKILKNIK